MHSGGLGFKSPPVHSNLEIGFKSGFPVFVYDDKDRSRVWTPDFYIPKLGIYVEVQGSKNVNYDYRKTIYKKNGIPIIFIHFFKDEEKWKNYFIVTMKEFAEARYQEVMKMVVLDKM